MPTVMRHTAVLVLGCLLLALALAACGRGPSEAEIEATVEARIEQKQAEVATLEAKVETAYFEDWLIIPRMAAEI